MHLLAIIVFAIAALIGAWFVISEIILGETATKSSTIKRSENAGGFWFAISTKAAFVVFAIAILLWAFGLIGDPYASLRAALPTFFR